MRYMLSVGQTENTSATQTEASFWPRPIVYVYLVLFFAAYLAAAGLGQGLTIVPGILITFWPPAGIFVAALLFSPRRQWPWWIAAGCLAELASNVFWWHNPTHMAFIYFAANALEACTAALLLRKFVRKPFTLGTLEEVAAFVVLGAGIAPLVGATVIAGADALIGRHNFFVAFALVWLGDGSGLLISMPMTLVAIQIWRDRAKIPIRRLVESAVVGAILVAISILAFRGHLPSLYMIMPPLLWAAARFQMKGAATALGLITLTCAVTFARGGSFSGELASHEKHIQLQTFLAISAVSALVVAVLSLQHRQALAKLRDLNAQLESRIAERTADLRARERDLRALADNAPIIIGRFNRQFRHVFVNAAAAQLTGIPVDQFIGKTNRELQMPPAACDLWEGAIQQAFETGQRQTMRFSFQLQTGEVFFESELVPERDDTGQVVTVLALNWNVTQAVRAARDLATAKEAADAANAAKDRFLAVLSHELRTPLSPVKMQVALWELMPDLPPAMQPGLAMIRRNIDLEARLIDDMLDLSRIARGKLELLVRAININAEVRHAVASVESEAAAKNITLILHEDATHVELQADAARIQQVLWNLLKNAVKFTPAGGSITVITRDLPGGVEVDVKDSGVGIDPAVLPHVFNAFEQGGAEITRQFGGLGLGLAISRAIAELHNGRIQAYSAGRGQGATFTLTLPAAKAFSGEGDHPTTDAATPPSIAREHIRLLLVEDHEDTARLMARLLMSLGHDVRLARSVSEAKTAWASEGPFELLVSDVGLPDGTGHDLMRALSANAAAPIRGIALTGFGMEEDVRKSREAGFTSHLTKPVSIEQLEVTIQRVASARVVTSD